MLHDLREEGARIVTNARVLEIGDASVRFEVVAEGGQTAVEEVAADTVVLAIGLGPNPDPIEALREAGVPVEVVGDAKGVGYLEGAIRSGFRTAIGL